jgi:TIR domain
VKVFISHSRENSSAALKLSDALEKRGFRTWLDVRDLPVGVDLRAEIGQTLKTSDAWLFLIGPGPSDRGQQFEFQDLAEMEVDLDPSRAIIPVVIGSPDVPGFLTIRQYIRVDPYSIDVEAIADKAAQALSKPEETIDQEKLQRGREARERELSYWLSLIASTAYACQGRGPLDL